MQKKTTKQKKKEAIFDILYCCFIKIMKIGRAAHKQQDDDDRERQQRVRGVCCEMDGMGQLQRISD